MLKKFLLFLLLLALPGVANAAIPAGAVWEVRGGVGSDTNGGGFVAGGSGTDYSQQSSAQYALTNGVTNGTTTVATTSASADMVGNIAYIAGGTGSVTGAWYYISAETIGVSITVDRSTGLTSGTGVTINVGGAFNTPNAAAAVAVSGNKVFLKATATYTTTTNINFTAGASGGSQFKFIGYTSTRTDGGRATLQMVTSTGLTVLSIANGAVASNIIVDCNSLATCSGISITSGGILFNDTVKNYATAGIVANPGNSSVSMIVNNEVTGGTSSSGIGIKLTASSGSTAAFIANNYVHDGAGTGISCANSVSCFVAQNIVASQSGATSEGILLPGNANALVLSNTVYNSGQDGINSGLTNSIILNNVLTNNGRYGLNNTNTAFPAQPIYDGNAYFSNTTAARNGIDDVTISSSNPNGVNAYTNTKDVTLSFDPFVSKGTGNFSLNSTGGGGSALKQTGLIGSFVGNSLTNYIDFGAVQAQASAASAGGSFVFGQ
jgi:hypothetical protein